MALYMLDRIPQLMAVTNVVFDEKNTNKVERLGGKPLAKRWKPLPASLFPPNKGDLFLLGAPIVTAKAWKVLEPILGAHVEALPLAIPKDQRFVLNVLPIADCLDRKKSDLWKKQKDGTIYRVKAAVVRDGVPDAPIFRVPDVEISPVIVTEEVKRAVEKAKLRGWLFKPVKGGGKAAPKAKAAPAAPVARAKGSARAVAAAWKRIEAWAKANDVDLKLRKGASAAAIAKLEKHIGAPLPEEVSASLALHDGQDDYGCVRIDEWTIFGTKDVAREWDIWKKLLDGGDFEGTTSDAKRGIKNPWWSARWIPLTGNGSGDHLCADLDPAKGGTPGQIITMWHVDAKREIAAKGWAAWLEELAKNLESKRWAYREDDNALAPRKR